MVLIERQQLWVANCVFMILLNGENYPVPARKSKVKYPTRPGKKYEIPDPLDTRKFQKMKYPTRSIPRNSLPDPSLMPVHIGADTLKKPHDIITLSFSEVFFQVESQAN